MLNSKTVARSLVGLSCTLMLLVAGCMNVAQQAPKETPSPAKTQQTQPQVYTRNEVITSPSDAYKLLVDGNKRYVSGNVLGEDISKDRKSTLSQKGQHPFTVVVSCSDSRVPPELIFDQGLGDLFVVRVAGNVVDAIEMGSIEYAVEHLHTPLVVVMGHEKCGAVKATVDKAEVSDNIAAIAKKIQPAVNAVQGANQNNPDQSIYEKVTDANVEQVVKTIKADKVIKKLIDEKKLNVVGAKYHIDSGEVTFADKL